MALKETSGPLNIFVRYSKRSAVPVRPKAIKVKAKTKKVAVIHLFDLSMIGLYQSIDDVKLDRYFKFAKLLRKKSKSKNDFLRCESAKSSYISAMSIVGVLPAMLLAIVFLLLGWLVWRRKGWWALLPFGMGALLFLYALQIYGTARGHGQALADYQQLLRLLEREEVGNLLLSESSDVHLYLVSLASQAMYYSAQRFPAQRERVAPLMARWAAWVADSRAFGQWARSKRWNEEVFFLAHAGIILGHYQLLTKDETHSKRFRQCGEFLGNTLLGAKYKNIPSRPEENFIRPADNAAALYAVSLYDQYYATDLSQRALVDWLAYTQRELEYAESHLPCSAFSADDRCKLDPTASSLGMMIAYAGAAGNNSPQMYREWLHYFKKINFSPIYASFVSDMKNKNPSKFCDIAAFPLTCDDNLDAIALWLAAEHGGDYTFARVLSKRMLASSNTKEQQFLRWRPNRQIPYLTDLSIWVVAGMK